MYCVDTIIHGRIKEKGILSHNMLLAIDVFLCTKDGVYFVFIRDFQSFTNFSNPSSNRLPAS